MNPKRKKIFAVLFLSFISVTGLLTFLRIHAGNGHLQWSADAQTDQRIINNLPAKEQYMLPGYALSYVTGKHYYSENRIWIDPEGHMMHSVPARDMSKNAQALSKLYRDCRRLRKRFLFVLCPGKPMEDGVLSDYGFDAYANQNADELLDLLKKFGVPCMDLRPAFKAASGGDIDRYFYRTEHHWNASGGLLAADLIAKGLNSLYGMGLAEELLREDKYTAMVYPASWIGEMGQKSYGILSGAEDYEVLWPDFDHKLTFVDDTLGIHEEGRLDIVLNKEALATDHLGSGRSMYYAYMYANDTLVSLTNHGNMQGRLLVVKDSLSNVCLPYLALAAKQITTWDVREEAPTDLYTYLENQPDMDAVVVCYQNETASNSSMFTFRPDWESPLKVPEGAKLSDRAEAATEGEAPAEAVETETKKEGG